MEERKITAETANQIEEAINACKEVAALAYILQGAFLDPSAEPTRELAADAAAGIGRAVERIGKDLDAILSQIYQENKGEA